MKHLPREHGGTVMVFLGALAGWLSAPHLGLAPVAMFVAILATFFLRDPLGLLLKRPPAARAARREMLRASALWMALALASTVAMIVELPLGGLARLAGLGAPLFLLLVFARATRRERKPWAETVGVASLLLPPVAMRFAAIGLIDREALLLGSACGLFFTGAILHLRTLVRARRSTPGAPQDSRRLAWLFSPAAAGLAFALFAVGLLPLAVAAANAVALLRPLLMRGWTLGSPKRIGFTETGLAVAFLALLTLLG